MRQYRGKQIDNGEWVYGWYYEWRGTPTIFDPESELDSKVNLSSVGQFTGLKDKNGVEIYEGDIVDYTAFPGKDTQSVGLVEWESKRFRYVIDGWTHVMQDPERLRVIGNIHQNPELLENK